MVIDIAKEVTKEVVGFLKCEKRPSISILMYLLSGAIALLSIISKVSPFHISMDFLDDISWSENLSNDDILIELTFWLMTLYLLFCVVRNIVTRTYQEASKEKLRVIYANVYTIEDLLNLICSIFSLFFIMAVFIQIYNYENFYISFKACIIYAVIGHKSLGFLICHYRVHNLKIIDNVLKKYEDMY